MSVKPENFINGSNHHAVRLSNGNEFYWSYNTLVAAKVGNRTVRTSKFWSKTTSKHLGQFGMSGAEQIPQEDLEALA